MLGHKSNLSKFKKTDIIPDSFLTSGIKLEIKQWGKLENLKICGN